MEINELILAIITKQPCTKVKLAKLILFIERDYYMQYGKSLTGSYYVKMPLGPVPANFDRILDDSNNKLWNLSKEEVFIQEKHDVAFKHIYHAINPLVADTELAPILDDVLSRYDGKSGTHLSDLSHTLPAWKFSEQGEPIYIQELVIEDDSKYFALQELAEEIEDMEEDSLYADLSSILPQ